tara:strand:- start:2175 stop:5603 length:3429 start_codon:yes stop_codon:yes gene_type:complete
MSKRAKKTKSKRHNNTYGSATSKFKRELHAARDFRYGLSSARKLLELHEIPVVVKEMGANPIYKSLFAVHTFPKRLSDYGFKRRIGKITPECEMMWTASVLSLFRTEIKLYVSLRDDFYNSWLSGEYDAAERALDIIEEKLGWSLWLIRSRLQVLQVFKGLQAQKDFLEIIVSEKKLIPLVKWFAYYFSLRAENSTSYESFVFEISPLITGQPQDLEDCFVRYLLPGDISDIEGPANPVSWDEALCVIDRFETFTQMSVLYYAKYGKSAREFIVGSVGGLTGLGEKVIDRMWSVAKGRADISEELFIELADSYTEGNYEMAIKPGVDGLEITAKACVISNYQPEDGPDIKTRIIYLMCKILSISSDAQEARQSLEKILLLLGGHLYGYQLASFLTRKHDFLFVRDYSTNDVLLSLTAPNNNPIHAPILSEITGKNWLDEIAKTSPGSSTVMLRCVLDGRIDVAQVAGLPLYRLDMYKAHVAKKKEQYGLAVSLYKKVINCEIPYVSNEARRHLFNTYIDMGELVSAMYLVADHVIENSAARDLYFVENLCRLCMADENLACEIGLPLLVHIASQKNGLEFQRDLSDVYENFLERNDFENPRALLALKDLYKIKYVVYFLRFICVPRILDDTTCYDSIDEINLERIALCQILLDLDPENNDEYLLEIRNVTRDNNVAHLLNKVQTSKIYVDEDGVRQALNVHLKGDFIRYKQLLESPELSYQAEKLSKLMGDLMSSKGHPELKDLRLPATERESLFASMLHECVSQFALNPAYGLDTHLSTSIRHGAFEGHLRSPLAIEELLYTVGQSGCNVQTTWRNVVPELTESELEAVKSLLAKFTNKFERLIKDCLEFKLHIQPAGKNQQLFSFDASAEVNEELMQWVNLSTSYDAFLERLISHCWDLTEESLKNVRHELVVEIGAQMDQAFDSLASAVNRNFPHLKAVPILDSIARARTSFQFALESVAEWFHRRKDISREPFDVEVAVHVALEQIKNCYVTTPLCHTLSLDVNQKLNGRFLDGLCEILFILIQNVIIHGKGVGSPATFTLSAALDDGVLSIECKSQLNSQACFSESKQIAAEATRLYKRDSALRMARQEGGSGLSKVWRIAEFNLKLKHELELFVAEDEVFFSRIQLTGAQLNDLSD